MAARLGRKQLADARALEEQSERMNPVGKTGATPSMGVSRVRGGSAVPSTGLSQYRGGGVEDYDYEDDYLDEEGENELVGGGEYDEEEAGEELVGGSAEMEAESGGSEGEEELEGGGKHTLMDHIKHPKKGFGTKKGQMRKTAHLAFEAKPQGGARQRKQKMSEAAQMGLHLGQHLHSLHGAGFWDDFKSGFNMVMSPVAGIAKSVLPLAGPMGMAASGALGALGYGKKGCGKPEADMPAVMPKKLGRTRKMAEMEVKVDGGFKSGRYEGKGHIVGAGAGDMARCVGAGKKKRAPAGASDGRRARAQVVKKVMADRGVSMIEASKIVKAEGLY